MTPERPQLVNPYRQGADDGFWFGIYMTALFFASAFALQVKLLGVLSTLMLLAIPVIIGRWLYRTWRRDRGLSLFSSLWMQGIMIFLCGSLISGLVAFCYLRWANPGWLVAQVEAMVSLYRSINGGQVVADTLEKMIDLHLLPSPIQMVIQMLWAEVFFGSIVTLLVTLVVRSMKVRPNSQQQDEPD